MAWIESHQSLSRHRKTLRAVAELKIDRHKFLGHLHELWWWGLDNVPSDGHLGDLSDREIAEGAGWMKSPEAFVEAITRAGWIDDDIGGRFLHDWPEYAGKYQQRREINRGRMRSVRTNKEDTDAKSAAHVQRTNRARVQHPDAARAEPEKRREEDSSSAANAAGAPGKPVARPITPAPKPPKERGQLSRAVKAANVLLHITCDQTQRDEIDKNIPVTDDAQETWEGVLKEWRNRMHRPQIRGPLDWFADGIPPGKPQRNGTAASGAYVAPGTAKQPPPPTLSMTPEAAAASDAARQRVRDQIKNAGIGDLKRAIA